MKTLLALLIPLFTVINIYGFESLPRLRWVKAVNEFSSAPRYFLNFSEGTFLSAGGDKIDVVDAKNGTVKQTISGINMANGFTGSTEKGYVAVGGNKITLLDSSLEISWSKPVLDGLTLASAVQTSDSGFIALGKTNDTTGLIIKTDRNLNIIWTRVVSNLFWRMMSIFPQLPEMFQNSRNQRRLCCMRNILNFCCGKCLGFHKFTYKCEKLRVTSFDGLYLYDMIG